MCRDFGVFLGACVSYTIPTTEAVFGKCVRRPSVGCRVEGKRVIGRKSGGRRERASR